MSSVGYNKLDHGVKIPSTYKNQFRISDSIRMKESDAEVKIPKEVWLRMVLLLTIGASSLLTVSICRVSHKINRSEISQDAVW